MSATAWEWNGRRTWLANFRSSMYDSGTSRSFPLKFCRRQSDYTDPRGGVRPTLRSPKNSSYFTRTRSMDSSSSSCVEFKSSINLIKGGPLAPGDRPRPKGSNLLSCRHPNGRGLQVCDSWLIQGRGLKSQSRHALHEKARLQCEGCDTLLVQYVTQWNARFQKKESQTGGMSPMDILSSNSRRYLVVMRTGLGSLGVHVRPNSKAEPISEYTSSWVVMIRTPRSLL